jgi:hypothetical protein
MTKTGSYTTGAALRQALEHRLNRLAVEAGVDVQRLRRHVAFDRLLARIFASPDGPWRLKGGYSLELRLNEARATRDVDLTLLSPEVLPEAADLSTRLQAGLQRAVNDDPGDFFVFRVGPVKLELDAAPYGGARFPVDARLAGRTFARFHVDIGVGDPLIGVGESVEGGDWLGFAGITAARIVCISREQQFAEKLHAYTMTNRPAANSRVKDLVDLALLIQRLPPQPDLLREALRRTFSLRSSHELPPDLQEPPESWEAPFVTMAAEANLDLTIAEALELVRAFYRSVTATST